jgi:hypothetical protein
VEFAFSIASACVRKVSTETTGPKISSAAMRCAGATSVNRVGANQKPRSGRSQTTLLRRAPSSSPLATSAVIRSSCSRELIAPTSVFLSSGSPSRRRAMRAQSFSTTVSATLSWIMSREPAQQTWPWLKKIPFTIPSTAWSSAASSKTMFADFPPSSRVAGIPRPASAAWMFLPTAVEPVNATLSISGSRTSAAPAAPSPGMIDTTPGGSSAS